MNREAEARELLEKYSPDVLRLALEIAEAGEQERVFCNIYVDGGCLGSGSSAAEAYYSVKVIHGEYVRWWRKQLPPSLSQTNNVAEYYAVREALQWVKDHCYFGDVVTIHTDSQLVVGQITSGWKVRAQHLVELWQQCTELLNEVQQTKDISIVKEPRSVIVAQLGH